MEENYLVRAWVNGKIDRESWVTLKEAEKIMERRKTLLRGQEHRVVVHYLDADGRMQLVEVYDSKESQ